MAKKTKKKVKTVNRLGLAAAVDRLQKNFKEGLKLIATVRDEGQLELSLGKLDLKKRWAALGDMASKAEHEALQRAPRAVDDALKALHKIGRRASKATKRS